MFRTLALVAVWQEQRKPAQSTPLSLARTDELVDNDLGTVSKVTELGFPDNQRVGRRCRVAILETKNRLLRQ